jgi:S-DNA-T family DNA segregation ATPase FtsK/SpoIIIE
MTVTDSHTALGVVNATAGPLVAAAACAGADITPAAPAGLAAAIGAGLLARHWLGRVRAPWSEAAFKAATALSGGAWATWSTITSPWHVTNLVVGAGAAILGGLLAPAFLRADQEYQYVDSMTPAGVIEGPVADERAVAWKPRIERICRVKPITITAVVDWPNGAGYTIKIRFAAESGDTWQSITPYTAQLAGAVYLPKGCVIGVAEGDRQGTAEVRIPTVNALGETNVWMSAEAHQASITDDHRIGVHDDTSAALVNLRQEAGLIVSMRGGGKTNLLNRLICRLLECEDNLTWIVDLNGGGLAVPFLMPWVDGQVDRCPIDAIAVDAKSALLMAQAAAAIAIDRKARYARLKARANTDLLPVSADLPQITIVIDESAEVYEKAPKAMATFLEVQRIGRAEAVNIVFSALRGTQDTVPVPVRKQAVLKVCGAVESDGELEYVIPGTRLRSADLLYPGTMYLSRGKGARQIKVERTSPALIAAVVCGAAGWRPSLDTPAEVIAGDWYATRWEKLRPWLAKLREEQAGDVVDAPAPAKDGDSPLRTLAEAVVAGHVQADDATKETLQKALDAERDKANNDEPTSPAEREAAREKARENLRRFVARQAAEERLEQMDQAAVDDVFNAVVAGLGPAGAGSAGSGAAGPATLEATPQWSPEMLIDIVRDNPGITPTGMLEQLAARGITISEKTLYKWLDRYVEVDHRLRRENGRYEVIQ